MEEPLRQRLSRGVPLPLRLQAAAMGSAHQRAWMACFAIATPPYQCAFLAPGACFAVLCQLQNALFQLQVLAEFAALPSPGQTPTVAPPLEHCYNTGLHWQNLGTQVLQPMPLARGALPFPINTFRAELTRC